MHSNSYVILHLSVQWYTTTTKNGNEHGNYIDKNQRLTSKLIKTHAFSTN